LKRPNVWGCTASSTAVAFIVKKNDITNSVHSEMVFSLKLGVMFKI
jgi:hypothetical protein